MNTMNLNTKNRLGALILIVIPFTLFAQVETVFNGVRFDESLQTVLQKVNQISKTTNVIAIDNPSFPLAKVKEEHLICNNVMTKEGNIAKVAFTFADDKLTYIEATGNAVKSLIESRKDTADIYMDYTVFFSELLFANVEKDKVWMLTEESVHPNLFTWENPYLTSSKVVDLGYSQSGKVPDFISMGGHIDELTPLLKANSAIMNVEELDGSDPNAQTQINCFGVDYAGFPRKIEARFGDNKLNMVWILTGKGEEDRIRKKLMAAYGDAIYKNEAWEVFNDWQVLLRKDKPEILLLTKELGASYKEEYFKE